MRRYAAAAFAFTFALAWLWSDAAHGKIIFRVKDLGTVALEDMVEDLRQARVIFFGERHDSAEDHVAQRSVLQSLHERGEKVAVGLEMFRSDAQPSLDRWVDRTIDAASFRAVYDANWDPKLYELYNDLLIFARQEKIPLVGLNIRRQIVAQVAREGFASLSPGQRRELKVDSCDVSERYERTLQDVTGSKNMSPRAFKNFCEAQITWDAAMARNIADYLESNPDRKMLVVLGTFHAWRHGVPARLKEIADVPLRVVLPSRDERYLNYGIIVEDADYVWWQQ